MKLSLKFVFPLILFVQAASGALAAEKKSLYQAFQQVACQSTGPPGAEKLTSSKKPNNTTNSRKLKRILNGKPLKKGDWPYLVSIFTEEWGNWESHHCGGSIIGTRWILTAGHCVQGACRGPGKVEYLKKLRVKTGEHHIYKGSEVERSHLVEKVFLHPKFTDGMYGHDLALVFLVKEIKFAPKKVAPVCLPVQDAVFPDGTDCFVAGWGIRGPGKWTDTPFQAHSRLISTQECRQLGYVTDPAREFCTSAVTGNSCPGDSGGPVVCFDKKWDYWYQVGIASSGSACKTRSTAVNVRLTYFINWIDDVIWESGSFYDDQ